MGGVATLFWPIGGGMGLFVMNPSPSKQCIWEANIAGVAFWTLLALLALVVVVSGPFLTSDGPAHVSMAHFLLRAGDPAWPMLNRLYKVNPILPPNALSDLLLAGLMWIVPPLTAEQIVQGLCLVSVPLAARLTLRRLAPESAWIALFFFPVALQRLFFLGLYNYCLSLTGALLCVWGYLRFRERGSIASGVLLSGLLFGTCACQAAGWIEAVLAIATMASIDAWLRWRAGEGVRAVIRQPAAVLSGMLPGIMLFGVYVLLGPGDGRIVYGPSPVERLTQVLRGDPFAPIGRTTAIVSLMLGLTLMAVAAAGAIRFFLELPREYAGERRLRVATCMLPLVFLGFLLIIPDEAGGGWTHTLRAEVFPYVGLALVCAVLPTWRAVKAVAAVAAAGGSVVAIGMAFWVQVADVPSALKEFNEANDYIGPHCTIAPVLAQFKLDPENTARLYYHPFFHIADRFELRLDRPVLFSYIARLPIYLVEFRPNADPQRLLYGWQPSQRDTHVTKLNLARFEAESGIPVDYVLLWDVPTASQSDRDSSIRAAIADARYRLVFKSSGNRMELYQRPGPGGCTKPLAPGG